MNLQTPVVMGILNVTPDSFYMGHLNDGIQNMNQLAGEMLAAGASIIDVGGQSTRPGSERVAANIEWKRIQPVIHELLLSYPEAIISIDTYYSEVARLGIEAGAAIIND
ncbi:MAG: dihydropteroate synthase, partial [Ferruginibacter sp.]